MEMRKWRSDLIELNSKREDWTKFLIEAGFEDWKIDRVLGKSVVV